MATTNRSRNAEFARMADDDPFAELTRIVEQEAQLPAGDHAHAVNDPLGLDMENELLGNLARFERPERDAPTADPEPVPAEQAEALAGGGDADLAMDAEFEAAFADEWSAEDGAAASEASGSPESVQSPDLEAGEGSATVAWSAEPDVHGADSSAATEEKINLFDRIAAELRTDDAARPEVVEDAQARSLSDEEITAFAAGWEEQNRPADHDGPLHPTSGSAPEIFSSTDEEDIRESGPLNLADEDRPGEQETVAEGLSADQAEAIETPMDIPDLLLDSDLEMTFADEEPHDPEDKPETSASGDVVFDYDKAAADRHDYLDHVLDGALPDIQDTGAAAETGEAVASVSEPAPGEDDAAPGHGVGLRAAMASGLATVPFWGKVRPEPAALEEDAATTESVSAPAYQADNTAAEDTSASPHDGRPQIETIDIEDRAATVADDLDIPEPELPPEPAADSEFDELAAELAGAFGEMTDEALAEPHAVTDEPPQQPAVSAGEEQYHIDQPAAGPAPLVFEEQYQFETAVAGVGFDAPFEPQARGDFNSWSGGAGEDDTAVVPPVRRRVPLYARFGRRGMLGAAALAGLVLIGGVSVFALTAGGGGIGQPALIQASDEPFKVKPKDTGGSDVSADNNEVYQRASGTTGTAPEQKALFTSAEKPVDLTKAVAPRIVDASAVRAASSDAPTAKSEARLTPADDAQATDVPPALTVQARRVETFIVRPDGTLVPREPATDATKDVASAQPDAETPGENTVTNEAGDASGSGAALNDDSSAPASASTAPVEPVKESIAPAERPASVEVASKAPAAATDKPALAPAATQAATSDWSVQISSQPSAEAAQESYRTMAQRYGDLLAGRGVNIVKADISGKGTYYRVRIPSASKDEAINLCTKLKSAGGNCFVSK